MNLRLAGALLIATLALSQELSDFDPPLEITVPTPPTAFQGGGRWHMVYELHITNLDSKEVVLQRLEAGGKRLEAKDLEPLLMRPGMPKLTFAEKLKLGAGLRAIVPMWITVDRIAQVPESLDHKLTITSGDPAKERSVSGFRVAARKGPPVIGPPLQGGEWLAANGPSNISVHRRAMLPHGGAFRVAQRFAIDFVRLRDNGRSFDGDAKVNANYRCYGSEALAVADSVVASIKDGIPENVPGPASRAVPITMATIGGNFVILDLGAGRFAFYAHLQPGSLRVKAGDKVRRGQVLGLVGNSGNSTEPHLHFHISDANAPLVSEGLPYAFAEFERQGSGFGWKPGSTPSEPRYMEMPLQNDVVRFPDNSAEARWKPVASWPPVPQSVKWDKPSSMTLDAAGRLLIFHRGAPALLRYDRAGKLAASWSSGYFKMAHGLKVAPDGSIWVTDAQRHVIVKFSAAGKELQVLGVADQQASDRTHFGGVADLAFLPNGDFYVADGYRNSRVVKFDKTGRYLMEWGKPGTGPGEFNLPHAIALDASGRVYVGDRENKRIQIFTLDGKFIEEWKAGSPYGLAFGPDGHLWMADGINNRVVRLDPKGKVVDAFTLPVETTDGTGGHMVAVDSDGSVYVAETGRYKVRKYRANY